MCVDCVLASPRITQVDPSRQTPPQGGSVTIVKLSARIVKRCWSSYGLPYVTKAFCVEPEVRLPFIMLLYPWAGCLFCLGLVMQGEGDGGGTSRAADITTSPSSHASDNHQFPQGDAEADRGAAGDQGDGATCNPPKGHLESVEGCGADIGFTCILNSMLDLCMVRAIPVLHRLRVFSLWASLSMI
jgi:hypothetical protein